MRVLDPQPIIWGYHLISVCVTFLTSGGQYSYPEEKSTRVLRSKTNSLLVLLVNQPNVKTTDMPVYMSGYDATCSPHSVNRSFADVVHFTRSSILTDRNHFTRSSILTDRDHFSQLRSLCPIIDLDRSRPLCPIVDLDRSRSLCPIVDLARSRSLCQIVDLDRLRSPCPIRRS